jgi:hypothetical protein
MLSGRKIINEIRMEKITSILVIVVTCHMAKGKGLQWACMLSGLGLGGHMSHVVAWPRLLLL